MDITLRKLSDITLKSEYLRVKTNVDSLKKSIENIGLINPLTINKNNELLAGARRFQAISELNWTEVPVHVIDRDTLEQELISIDENLVRSALNKLELEKCLNRGREIYETLNPTANKIDISAEELTPEKKQQKKEQDKLDENSFAAVTAEKTGLSKSSIKSAIKRDELASDSVKKAREQGELSATQTNALITLAKEDQEAVLPLIVDKTVKEAKKIIDAAKSSGVSAAQQESEKVIPLPKEYALLKGPLKRVNKSLDAIVADAIIYKGSEQAAIHKDMLALKEHVDAYFALLESDS